MLVLVWVAKAMGGRKKYTSLQGTVQHKHFRKQAIGPAPA